MPSGRLSIPSTENPFARRSRLAPSGAIAGLHPQEVLHRGYCLLQPLETQSELLQDLCLGTHLLPPPTEVSQAHLGGGEGMEKSFDVRILIFRFICSGDIL